MTGILKLGLIAFGAMTVTAAGILVFAFVYVLLGDSPHPDWLGWVVLVMLMAYTLGTAVYLTVDVAIRRHQQTH